MTIYIGFVTLPTDSYANWKAATLGNGFDYDQIWGCQCVDLCNEFWQNVGFAAGYPLTGPNQSAYECWTVNRNNNISYNGTQYFDLIYNLSDVKQGDVIVWNYKQDVPAGHIGFADEDYDGSGYIMVLGQNQGGGVPYPSGGTTTSLNKLGTDNFLGAFRYKPWHETPPPPTPTTTRFPWVLYARNMRKRRQ